MAALAEPRDGFIITFPGTRGGYSEYSSIYYAMGCDLCERGSICHEK